MDERRSKDVSRMVVTDAIVLVSMCLIAYLVSVAPPTKRGFFCDDESIRYPYKSSTVPTALLYTGGLFLLILVILLVEHSRNAGIEAECTYSPYRLGDYRIPSSYWNIFRTVVCFVYGFLYSEIAVESAKVLIGRLRPNFIDVCRPQLETLCSDPNNHSYVEKFNCTYLDLSDSRRSFPSGHACFSFYEAVFLVIYLQKNLRIPSIVTKTILQFGLIALAWFVALSRVTDNMHHWGDVLAGMLIGSVAAILSVNTEGTCETLQICVPGTNQSTERPEDPLLPRSKNQASSSDAKQHVPLLT